MIPAMLALVVLVIPACGDDGEDFRFTVHPAGGTVSTRASRSPGPS
jgi:hypothetical protein